MVNIKRARNDFNGFRATVSEAEFDGFMYILDAALNQYKETGSVRLEGCQKVVRAWTEFGYFDKENREVHLQMGFRELEAFTTALYDVMLVHIQPDSEHSFAKLLERPETKIWKSRDNN